MCVRLAGERVNEGEIIRELREMRDHVAHPLAGLTALAEGVLRACEIACGPLERDGRATGQGLVVPLDEFGFVVPGFKLADGTGAEDDDHVFCFAGKMWLARCVGSRGVDDGAIRLRRQQAIEAEEIGQCDGAECRGAAAKKATAVEQRVASGGEVFGGKGHN